MAANDIFIYTNATSVSNAVITSNTVTTAASFPDLVLGDSPTYNFRFTDGAAAVSWAGNAQYSIEWALGTSGADDSVVLAYQTQATAITGGWTMVLPLNTGAILSQLNSARISQEYPVVRLWQQIRVTDPSGYKTTYATIRTNLRLRTVPNAQPVPDDPLPAGYRHVLTDAGGSLAAPGNFISSNGLVTLAGSQALTNKTLNGAQALAEDGPSLYNTKFGNGIAANKTTAAYLSAFGYQAGAGITSGYACTFFGVQAGFRVATGNYNLAVGVEALANCTTGNNNCAVGGYDTLLLTTTGSDNTALGYAAGYKNQDGDGNTLLGINAGYEGVSADNNTMVGASAGYNATGGNNACFGTLAGYALTGGTYNTLIGRSAGINLTSGSNCVALGDSVTFASATANNQVNLAGIYKGTRGTDAVIAYTTLPETDAAQDLGSVAARWRDLRLSRNLFVGNNIDVSGTIGCLSITSGAPNGGIAAAWKFGVKIDATTALDTTKYLQVDVGGTLYRVALVTS